MNAELKKTYSTWRKRLAKAGWVDIEETMANGEYGSMLISHTQSVAKQLEQNQDREEYYRLARRYTYRATFTTPIDRQVWELHAEGHSYRDIQRELGVPLAKVMKIVNFHKAFILSADKQDEVDSE